MVVDRERLPGLVVSFVTMGSFIFEKHAVLMDVVVRRGDMTAVNEELINNSD